jgi:probable rRNA maturation factor
MVKVNVVPRQPALGALIQKAVAAAFAAEKGPARSEISVIFVNKPRIRALNKKFRHVNRNTDVISFRYPDPPRPMPGPRPFGDLYVSAAVARENARRFGVTYKEEIARLAVHGTLHLFGYTDYQPRPKKIMWDRQEKILAHVLSRHVIARSSATKQSVSFQQRP